MEVNSFHLLLKKCVIRDHHKLGVIDRFIRTLRGIIEKYLTMNKT